MSAGKCLAHGPERCLNGAVPTATAAALLTAALAIGLLLLAPPGADLPAQAYRAHLFARGVTLWDGQWYGGHYLPSYSLLAPPLESMLGPRIVSCLGAVCSTWLFSTLVIRHFGARARVAALLFAVAVLADVAVGRSTFGLGQALALAALLALSRRAWPVAIVLALLTAASSPVAAALLALAAAVVGVTRRAPAAIAVAAAAAVPVVVSAGLFPDGGSQPFATWSLVAICVVVGGGLVLLPRHERPLRLGIAAYGLACVLAYLIPNPLGSNILRLGMLFGAPLIVAARQPRRSLLVAAAVAPILAWQAMPAIAAIERADGDPSLAEGYYRPLVEYLVGAGARSARVEIPMTLNHWESAYVAPEIALARGWERQLDVRFNGLFYAPRLSA